MGHRCGTIHIRLGLYTINKRNSCILNPLCDTDLKAELILEEKLSTPITALSVVKVKLKLIFFPKFKWLLFRKNRGRRKSVYFSVKSSESGRFSSTKRTRTKRPRTYLPMLFNVAGNMSSPIVVIKCDNVCSLFYQLKQAVSQISLVLCQRPAFASARSKFRSRFETSETCAHRLNPFLKWKILCKQSWNLFSLFSPDNGTEENFLGFLFPCFHLLFYCVMTSLVEVEF